MSYFRKILDFLGSFSKAIPAILILLGIVSYLLSTLASWSQTPMTLPRWGILVLVGFAIYGPLRFAEYAFNKYRKPVFSYAGMKWKPAFFSFQYPTPLCPHCERDVISKINYPPPVLVARAHDLERKLQTTYSYECPIHGKIYGPIDMSLKELLERARIVQNGN